MLVTLDGAQGWFLSALCGAIIALIAYSVDVAESTVFDFKDGFCAKAWYLDEKVRAYMKDYTVTPNLTLFVEMLPSRLLRRLEELVRSAALPPLW